MACDLVFPVFKTYEKELLGFIRNRLRGQGDAEEIFNQVLLKVYKNCEKLPQVRNARAWLYQITRNALYDYFKENQQLVALEENHLDLQEDTERSLYQMMEPLLPAMIDMLPRKYAEPLYLSDILGIPQKEIATRLGLSLSGAKSRVQRGREKLKELFFKCTHLELDDRGIPISFAVKEACTPLVETTKVKPQLDSDRGCDC